MTGYYDKNLSADRLKKVYEVATPRVKQYLQAEIDFVLKYINSTDTVIELGCGYGRVLKQLAEKAKSVFGIDSSNANIRAAKGFLRQLKNIRLFTMDAAHLAFKDNSFDRVICIQNGISAFNVNPEKLVFESIRILKKNGIALFSSYSEKFWVDRLEWFKTQSNNKLLGEIDWDKTKKGKIICKDGFIAKTYSKIDFERLMAKFEVRFEVIEVDKSSLFCVIEKMGK
jgi:2-polyprenyl-6-hydroxyphenyl methylase/3-demethylubiquinone-9 3-methyltransferase